MEKKTIKISDLKNSFYAFGGKGDVWSNTAHIGKSGQSTTLCRKPMLSSNWVRIEKVEFIGCEKCINNYNDHEKETFNNTSS